MTETTAPRPWSYKVKSGDERTDNSTWGAVGFWDADGGLILGSGDGWDAEFDEPGEANAALIVKAVNDHDALERQVEVLRTALETRVSEIHVASHPTWNSPWRACDEPNCREAVALAATESAEPQGQPCADCLDSGCTECGACDCNRSRLLLQEHRAATESTAEARPEQSRTEAE